MTSAFVIRLVLLLIGITAPVVFIAYASVRRLANGRTADLVADYPVYEWIIQANYFGRQSEGPVQARGTGTLLLTEDSLIFDLWLPKKRIIIPLKSIKNISNPRSFLGSTKGGRLLKIDFSTQDGTEDAAAWLVSHLAPVQSSIESLRVMA